MAGRVRHLLNRNGRYYARLVVTKDLRKTIGKTELRTPLGGDYRQALKLLPGAVADLQHRIAIAERSIAGERRDNAPRYPLTAAQIAHSHYIQQLAFDEKLRKDHRYASVGIDDLLVERLRRAVAGRADDAELSTLVGAQIKRFRSAGNLDATPGSDEWRAIALALCHAELEALARAAERDEGDFTGQPSDPLIANAQPPEEPPIPVNLSALWEDYKASRIQAGFMKDQGRRQNPVIKDLCRFLRHDDARRVTKKDLLNWRDQLMKDKSAKTVSDIYLSTVRSLFTWAEENDRLPNNVASTVKQAKPRRQYGRERGYSYDEALNVLKAARAYQPKLNKTGRNEMPHQVAAKRWCPIICAFTGARITEITQLRKEDVRQEDDWWIIRITPDAGSVKAGNYRDVPLHPQVIELGFMEFVKGAAPGPLFHAAKDPQRFSTAASSVSDKVAKWLRRSNC
ncbi:MAG: integrase [Sediminimonas qiaohouensis]|uniref:Integrase n=1 Tax=Sediminimonas qiaohouensis TaxID=552061 RepID=A0A7C9HN57_9RHOB|nr:integrase [Sediminimonas qiaohouensis]MTJ05628.1 integrase [Sediminimonas qiaohouensis]